MSEINRLIMNIFSGVSGAHAYILEGPAGEKRDRFVRDFIKGLNCQCDDISNRPCGDCPSCRQIEAGTSMDVSYMARSGKAAYKVDDASNFTERLGMGSYGRHIIGVIGEADLLSETVQNKLLKTLEEPEAGTIIVLAATNRDNLLKTVQSRCSVVRISDYVTDMDDDSRELDAAVQEAMKLLVNGCHFYKFRSVIDKKIKSREDAALVITAAEDYCRDRMIEGQDMAAMVRTIELLEMGRMDMYRGMDYGKVLRRVFLELA